MAGFDHFPQISTALHTALSQVIRKVAFDIQANAQVGAPVDTGFLKNSIYVVTSDSSDYGQGASSPPKDASLLPEVAHPDDDLTAIIAVGANYGIYVEMGTVRMAPQPYLAPAAEKARRGFEQAISAIEDKLKAAAL